LEAKIDLEEGIRRTAEFYRSQGLLPLTSSSNGLTTETEAFSSGPVYENR